MITETAPPAVANARAIDNATSVEDVDRKTRTITHKISTDCVDRYRTVLVPKGMVADNFRLNPVVLCNHSGMGSFPIGKNLDLKVYNRKIIARTRFLPEGMDPTADKVFTLYELGFLNAWSVSFDPKKGAAPTPDDVRKRPELAECQWIYLLWDLLEYSCVTVPGNPEACRTARKRGLDLPGWPADDPAPSVPAELPTPNPEPVLAALPPLQGRSLEQVLNATLEAARRELFGDPKQVARDILDMAKGRV